MSEYIRGGLQKSSYASHEVMQWPCPLCEKSETKFIDRERESLEICKCKSCNLIRVSPRVKEPEKVYWGDASHYVNESRLIFEGKKKHHRDSTYAHDLNLLKKIKPEGKFLDVGCNMGFFLKKAVEYGYEGYGVDPSESLSNIAREKNGLNVETAFLENSSFQNNFFDIVTMTDVFEHIVNPKQILSRVKEILKPDGVVLIKVPNARFNLLKWFVIRKLFKKSSYDIFDSYEHVVHYTDETLSKVLKQCCFQVLKIYVAPPIQLPNWHKFVGHYYQYETPWYMDFRKKLGRNLCYGLSKIEKAVFGRCGYFAPNIGVIAKSL